MSRGVPGGQQDDGLLDYSNCSQLGRPSYTFPPYPLSPNKRQQRCPVSNKKEGGHLGGVASTKWLSVLKCLEGGALMFRMQFIDNSNQHYFLTLPPGTGDRLH